MEVRVLFWAPKHKKTRCNCNGFFRFGRHYWRSAHCHPEHKNSKVGNQALAQTKGIVPGVAQLFIERYHLHIGGAHQHIDLWAAHRQQLLLDPLHEAAANGKPLPAWRHCQVIDRATMAVIAAHGGPDEHVLPIPALEQSHQKKPGLHGLLARNIFVGVIPRAQQAAVASECHRSRLVPRFKGTYLQCGGHALTCAAVFSVRSADVAHWRGDWHWQAHAQHLDPRSGRAQDRCAG